ncbi:hypothetical protein A3K88_18355 [Pseudomonas putida]|nr:hypothetical protein G1E_25361 [Pseudomonas sp. TJI-51]OAK60138.1 hypothetical protein A3K88_18355 [Pseudomonas putida]PPB15722.1 hypothetical protein HV87_13835 [Pseudomonas aeruginosa]
MNVVVESIKAEHIFRNRQFLVFVKKFSVSGVIIKYVNILSAHYFSMMIKKVWKHLPVIFNFQNYLKW